ncbi:MAG: penicillin-binding protein 2 [candidate division NC10 bacterium]|nr:penicillin-binding protein 2 [candidate division NC10 bacterium]
MREPEAFTSTLWPRIRWAARLFSLALLILLLRLWQLQILEGDRYYELSTQNRLRIRPVEAPRGFILDRNGEILVENKATFDVLVTPEDIPDLEQAASIIGEVLEMDPEEVRWRIQEAAKVSPYQPFILRKAIDERTMVAVEERKLELPGVSLRVRPIRAYPIGGGAANLLGYVREVSRAQLEREEFQDLRPGASIGQAGIERSYDTFIRGMDGGEQVEVDALGRVVRFLERLEPRSGYNISLTIDKRIQEAAEKAFEGKAGSVVAINPKTGEVLAFVSRPSYDPNVFAQRLSLLEWQQLITDPNHPFQNRPLQASYPPGSVFKLITAIAALEKGAITPDTKFTCPGYFVLGNHRFECWKKGGHGTLNLYQAIAKSCNVYFYNVALRTGAQEIIRVAREFGLGEPLGIGLEEEAKGFLPSLDGGQPWYPGNTVMLGIGQGMVATTPFQLLSLVSGIANGGTIYRPAFVKQIVSLEGEVVEEFSSQVLRKANVNPEVLAIIRRGMWGVVNEGGTGGLAKLPRVEVAGKTGTAQVVRKMKGAPKDLKDHAWFVAFAPYGDPTIALVVNVEHGGMGGQVAAPIGRAILEAAFKAQGPEQTPPSKAVMEQELGD